MADPGLGSPAPAPVPSKWSGRRIALLVGGIFGGAVTLVTVVALLAIFVVVPMWRASNPQWLVNNAAQRLEAAPAVHVRGSLLDAGGRRVEFDARVANDRLMGTQLVDGQSAEFRAAQDVRYVKGTLGFWNIVDPVAAGAYGDAWIEDIDRSAIRHQLDPFAEPDTLARVLREDFASAGKGEKRTVRGIATLRVAVPGKGAVYVARQEPYDVVRIEGPVVGGPSGSPLSGHELDVEEMSRAELDEFDAALDGLPEQLPTVITPGQATMPAYYVIEKVVENDNSCGAVSCQFQAVVKNLYGPARPGARNLLIGVAQEGKDGTGKVLGRCETALKPAAANAASTVSCVMSDPRWARWGGGWYTWRATTFNPGWDGADPAVMTHLIERPVEVELIDDVSAETGGLGLRTFARLVQYPGVNHADAAAAVKSAAEMGRLDGLLTYAETGRIGNPGVLRQWTESAAAARHTLAGTLPQVNHLQAAIALAKDGTGPVAMQSWTGGGVTVKADIVDVGRKEAVQVRTVIGQGAADVVAAARSGIGAVVAPDTFRRVLDLRIAHAGSPLYSLGKAELRDALRKAGLKASAGTIVIVNGAGRHEYSAADFR